MDSNTLFIISILLSLGIFTALFIFINNKFKGLSNTNESEKKNELLTRLLENMQDNQMMLQNTLNERLRENQQMLNNQLQHVQMQLMRGSETLNQRVDESSKTLNMRLDKAAEVINNVQKELGAMSEIGRGMKSLQDFLKAPKLRGNIGEEVLKDLLVQMIPAENFSLQYEFKGGDKVDAVLRVDEGLLSVDSKFPLENFNAMIQKEHEEDRNAARKEFIKNVKKHIDDISKKYILPDQGTLDFALMYIPSEAIYYEIVVNNSEELGKYSWSKRVLPVSPNVFYSYLKAILIGLEGKKIETRAKEILISIRSIKDDTYKFAENLRLMTKHLNNAHNSADDVNKSFDRLTERIINLDSHRSLNEGSEDKETAPKLID